MSVRKIWLDALKVGVIPVLAEAGFSGERVSTFRRRRGSADQIVSFRASRHNGIDEGLWILETGWDLDEIQALTNDTTGRVVVGGKPVWYSPSVSDLVPGVLDEWRVTSAADHTGRGAMLREAMNSLVRALDFIDSPAAMLERIDLSRGFEKVQRAQLKFVVGDTAGALADVQQVCTEFADRRGMTLPDVLNRSGLRALLGE